MIDLLNYVFQVTITDYPIVSPQMLIFACAGLGLSMGFCIWYAIIKKRVKNKLKKSSEGL
jgi:hypothetical protein